MIHIPNMIQEEYEEYEEYDLNFINCCAAGLTSCLMEFPKRSPPEAIQKKNCMKFIL